TSPSTPSGLAATAISSTQINLSWIPSTDNVVVAGYRVYRDGTYITSVSTTSYVDKGKLAPSTTFTYTISAFDAAGNNSSLSGPVSVTTPAAVTTTAVTDTQAPSVPTNLTTIAVSSSQINLSWTSSTDNAGVSGYKVYRDGTYITSVSSASYVDKGKLAPSTTFTYTVSAFDAAGNNSALSSPVSVTTPKNTRKK
ncbi:MAG: fibronectin type III domain-containing protein, partial [Nitrospiraceae bacterium]|nr:fibronectin type III domain-containing protein [Nitrospiraceae bacterium]